MRETFSDCKKTPVKMVTVENVTPFDSYSQSWEEYCKMLEYFFKANDIVEADKKKAILISCMGPATYSLMRSLVSPQKPGEKTFEELVSLLK